MPLSQQEGLFDQLVGASEQLEWQLKGQLPCSLLVHDQLKFGWRLNSHFRSIGSAQDSINIGGSACQNLVDLHPV